MSVFGLVSPGFTPRPSLSGDGRLRRFGCPLRCVAGVHAPARDTSSVVCRPGFTVDGGIQPSQRRKPRRSPSRPTVTPVWMSIAR